MTDLALAASDALLPVEEWARNKETPHATLTRGQPMTSMHSKAFAYAKDRLFSNAARAWS